MASCHADRPHVSKGLCGACYRRSLRYGISHERIEEMVREQEGRCAICWSEADLVVDHNHTTGNARAMLCQSCNILVGQLESNSHLVVHAVNYLRDHAG